jgi:hypothetical protein
MHVSEPNATIELRSEQVFFGLPVYLVVTFFAAPPEIAHGLFNFMADFLS